MSEQEAPLQAETQQPEPVQPEQTQAPEAEPAEQDADDTDSEERQPPKPKGVQKRIDELVRQRTRAEQEADHWRQVALSRLDVAAPPSAADVYQEPMAPEYPAADPRALVAEALQQERTMAKVRDFVGGVADQDVADFLSSPNSPLPASVWDVMLNLPADEGREVASWLATNQDKAVRIAQLPPHLQALEISRSVLASSKAKAPAKKASAAPAPVPTVGASGVPSADPSAMTTEQWMKWRQSQLRGR